METKEHSYFSREAPYSSVIDWWIWQHEELKQSWHVIAGLDDVEFKGTVSSLSSNAVGYLRQYSRLSLQRSDCVEPEDAMLEPNLLQRSRDICSSDSLFKVFGLGWSVLPISPTFEITNLYHQHFQSYIIHMIGWMLHILLVLRCSRNASASELWNQRGCLTIGMLKDFGTSTSPTTLVLLRPAWSLSCIVGGRVAITCHLVHQVRELGTD